MKRLSFALLLVTSACDQNASRPVVTGDASTATAAPSASSSAASSLAPVLDAGKAPAEPERTGAVTISQTKGSGTSLGAYFMETSAPGIVCTPGASAGGCTSKVCTRSLTPSVSARKTAGDIRVTVGQFPSTLAPTLDGTTLWYVPQSISAVKTGEIVQFSAAGAVIPAFEGTVTAPAWVTLSKPVIPPNPKTVLAIKQSTDLDFAWSPATKAVVLVTLARAEREKQTVVECTFDASESKASIAKSLLASIPPGHVVFTIDVAAKTELKPGNFAVTLAVSDSLLSGGATIVPE